MYLGGSSDKVSEHEVRDTGPPVVRRHSCQIREHQRELAGPIILTGATPAQIVQIEQRVGLAGLLK